MKVLERAAGHATGPYHVPAVDVESIAARTNNLVCGAFRGFGANQAQFAMDGVVDRLADAVGISGWEMRKRNVIRPGVLWGLGQVCCHRRPRSGAPSSCHLSLGSVPGCLSTRSRRSWLPGVPSFRTNGHDTDSASLVAIIG